MAKKVKNIVKLQVPAGTMAPTPTLGSVLGPTGVNMMEFFKQLSSVTKDEENGTPIPVILSIYEDRSFSFTTNKPPVSYYLKKYSGLAKGSKEPGRSFVAELSKDKIKEIAETKMQDLNANDIDAAIKIIEGSAYSMGIRVVK